MLSNLINSYLTPLISFSFWIWIWEVLWVCYLMSVLFDFISIAKLLVSVVVMARFTREYANAEQTQIVVVYECSSIFKCCCITHRVSDFWSVMSVNFCYYFHSNTCWPLNETCFCVLTHWTTNWATYRCYAYRLSMLQFQCCLNLDTNCTGSKQHWSIKRYLLPLLKSCRQYLLVNSSNRRLVRSEATDWR